VLEQFAWSNVLVAFDYDGTLAPIVTDPERAMIRATTRELLLRLTQLYPCIVISGRAQDDALRKLRGTGMREVVGNHGMEPWHGTNPVLARVRRWVPALQAALGDLAGVSIENKLLSVAVHYRRSREKKRARAAILKVAATLREVRVVGGKQVLNLLPSDAPHKGIALERARERFGCDTAIYLGDDETDEDVFGLDQPGRLLTVRVGMSQRSLADYCIPRQAQIDEFIRMLVKLRSQRQAQIAVRA
jgi:trehalose 6-phosphate phosphatase